MPVIVDHVHLIVTDVPRAVAWFKENFGAREKYLGMDAVRDEGTIQYYLDFGNTGMFIRGQADGEHLTPDPGNRYGINHVSLRVPDVYECLEMLRAKGTPVLLEPDIIDQNQVYAFVEGPDQIRVELIHRKQLG